MALDGERGEMHASEVPAKRKAGDVNADGSGCSGDGGDGVSGGGGSTEPSQKVARLASGDIRVMFMQKRAGVGGPRSGDDIASAHGSSSGRDASGVPAYEWACSTCTLLNAALESRCSVCGARRPGASGAATGTGGGACDRDCGGSGGGGGGGGVGGGASARRAICDAVDLGNSDAEVICIDDDDDVGDALDAKGDAAVAGPPFRLCFQVRLETQRVHVVDELGGSRGLNVLLSDVEMGLLMDAVAPLEEGAAGVSVGDPAVRAELFEFAEQWGALSGPVRSALCQSGVVCGCAP